MRVNEEDDDVIGGGVEGGSEARADDAGGEAALGVLSANPESKSDFLDKQ